MPRQKGKQMVSLPFTHLPRGKRPRKFRAEVLKKSRDYMIVLPQRQFFVQLIKFTPGKGPNDWVQFHKNMNRHRHAMDIHEIATFLTWGRHDMVVLWDAKDLETYNRFLASWINPAAGAPGTSETLVAASSVSHEPR